MSLYNFLNKQEETEILKAIKVAEENTSGEIIESECKIDALERAKVVFKALNMHKTELHNGVLFYIAADSRHFALVGDEGISNAVPFNFWEETKNVILTHFSNDKMAEGLAKGILLAGEQLKSYFPYNKKDKNELSDEISTKI